MSRNDPGGNGRESEFTSWTEKLRNSEKYPNEFIVRWAVTKLTGFGDMRVARSLPGPKTPRRKRHRIYALDHLVSTTTFLRRSSRRGPTQRSLLIRWPALEHFENFPVRAGKSQLAQFEPRTPASILKPRGRPVGEFNAIDVRRDPVARDPVPHSTEWFNGEWTRAEKIFRELPTLGSAPGQFDIWEFPEMGVDHAGRTPANEEASVSLDDEGRKSALS